MNEIKFTGVCTWTGEKKTWQSASGKEVTKQEFVITENEGQYPQSILVSVIGEDKLEEMLPWLDGRLAEFTLKFDAREWNGKYFNNVRVWSAKTIAIPPQPQETESDLPF